MTTKSAVLLTIKQNNGMDYNSLLSKFAANYSNSNSARAALSRTMKDLRALGYVEKKEGKFYVTEKATVSIYSEMKSKLLLKLNSSVNSPQSHEEIDTIVKSLHTMIERSKEDADLLKAARGTTNFYISDLEEINKKIDKKIKHFKYMTSIFSEQIKTLKSLDFNDIVKVKRNSEVWKQINDISSELKNDTVSIESNSQEHLNAIAQLCGGKVKDQTLAIKSDSLQTALKFMASNNLETLEFNLYLTPMTVKVSQDAFYFSSPTSILERYFRGK